MQVQKLFVVTVRNSWSHTLHSDARCQTVGPQGPASISVVAKSKKMEGCLFVCLVCSSLELKPSWEGLNSNVARSERHVVCLIGQREERGLLDSVKSLWSAAIALHLKWWAQSPLDAGRPHNSDFLDCQSSFVFLGSRLSRRSSWQSWKSCGTKSRAPMWYRASSAWSWGWNSSELRCTQWRTSRRPSSLCR